MSARDAATGAGSTSGSALVAENSGEQDSGHVFTTEMVDIDGQLLHVGRTRAGRGRIPLLMFNGIGGNVELLAPLALALPEREVICFDIPGVGGSPMPKGIYRLKDIVRLACGVLDRYGHQEVDVLGVSWGGAPAQQFAHSAGRRCRRLILCATAAGWVMAPASPKILLKMASPRRYMNHGYAKAIAGAIYGGDFRTNPALGADFFKNVHWNSKKGYYLQLAAVLGWTSAHWLPFLRQPTLVMAGEDDPIIPMVNAKLLAGLIPKSELLTFDCGHLFLLTRIARASAAITDFLDRGTPGITT